VGVGSFKKGEQPTEDVVPAPQIEAPDDPIGEIGQVHQPQGFGPICRAWLPRRALAGTPDEAWRTQRWPELPLDFSFDFYNSAHPDLIHPGYLAGDEDVVLEGIDPHGPLRFYLPGRRIDLLVKQMFGAYRKARLVLDTPLIDVPSDRAHITWRTRFEELSAIRAFEIRMI